MKTQLLSENGKQLLRSMLICCLWACMVPAAARAQAVFGAPACYYQVIQSKPAKFQIRGTVSVNKLDPQNASTTVTFTFQTRANANAQWNNLGDTVQQTTNGIKGTANFDTGWQDTGSAGQGVQYRIWVNGFYLDGSGKQVMIEGIGSPPITSNP